VEAAVAATDPTTRKTKSADLSQGRRLLRGRNLMTPPPKPQLPTQIDLKPVGQVFDLLLIYGERQGSRNPGSACTGQRFSTDRPHSTTLQPLRGVWWVPFIRPCRWQEGFSGFSQASIFGRIDSTCSLINCFGIVSAYKCPKLRRGSCVAIL